MLHKAGWTVFPFGTTLVTLERAFGDFGVSFVATVAGRYTRRGGPEGHFCFITAEKGRSSEG